MPSSATEPIPSVRALFIFSRRCGRGDRNASASVQIRVASVLAVALISASQCHDDSEHVRAHRARRGLFATEPFRGRTGRRPLDEQARYYREANRSTSAHRPMPTLRRESEQEQSVTK